jgi:Terminase small subunit
MDAQMTPKQQRFVAEYLTVLNATQAAIRAGYSAKTAGQGAAQALKNIKVREAIAAGQAKTASKLEITAEKVLKDLEEVREKAMAAGQFAPAARAIELLGKHLGMFIDRRETTLKDERMVVSAPPVEESAEEWVAKNKPH